MTPRARRRPSQPPTPPALLERVAHDASARVIAGYSTSFAAAVRLLDEPVRHRVRDVYAMVRMADELVDGAAAHLPAERLRLLLDDYETRVLEACQIGYSTDLVVHAFALTARRTGIGAELITPFFSSMRADLEVTAHDSRSLSEYVYGSAEVVGLMCLRVFLADEPDPSEAWDRLAPGAQRLGAAFQKVNFLRDLAQDRDQLGRDYLLGSVPGGTAGERGHDEVVRTDGSGDAVPSTGTPDGAVPSSGTPDGAVPSTGTPDGAVPSTGTPGGAAAGSGTPDGTAPAAQPATTGALVLDEETKARLVADIDADLAAADVAVRGLPSSSRRAVRAAHALFAELNAVIAATPAAELATRRVRVSDPRKAAIVARAIVQERHR